MPGFLRPHRGLLTRWLSGLLLAALAGCATTTASTAASPALDPVSAPEWAVDMARFAAEDRANPPPAHPYVFTGSSSVRMWQTLAQDFPASRC